MVQGTKDKHKNILQFPEDWKNIEKVALDPLHLSLDGKIFILNGFRKCSFWYFHVVLIGGKEHANNYIYYLTLSGGDRPVSFRKSKKKYIIFGRYETMFHNYQEGMVFTFFPLCLFFSRYKTMYYIYRK